VYVLAHQVRRDPLLAALANREPGGANCFNGTRGSTDKLAVEM
jgi:hypothetical protein